MAKDFDAKGSAEIEFQPGRPGSAWVEHGDVHVWRFALRGDLQAWAEWASTLTSAERADVQRYRREEDQERALISRGARRQLVAEVWGCDPAEVQFGVGPQGKPECRSGAAGRGELEFNVSHSGAWVLLALAQGRRVGVDVEQHREVEEARLVADYFSAREADAWRTLTPERRTAGFYALWTRKEAYVKALGVGMGKPLDRFSVTADPALMAVVQLNDEDDPTAASRWSFSPLPMDAQHSAALVVAGRSPVVRRWDWPRG